MSNRFESKILKELGYNPNSKSKRFVKRVKKAKSTIDKEIEEIKLLQKTILLKNAKTPEQRKMFKLMKERLKAELLMIKDFNNVIDLTDFEMMTLPPKKVIKKYAVTVKFYKIRETENKRNWNNPDLEYDNDMEYIKACDGYDTINEITTDESLNKPVNINDYELDRFYSDGSDGIDVINNFVDAMKLYPNMKSLNAYTSSKYIDGFKITSILEQTDENNYNPIDINIEDDSNLYISSKYTQYKVNVLAQSFKDLLELDLIDYLKSNYIPRSCVLTAIINKFYNKFNEVKEDGKRKFKELTYQRLAEILEIKLNDESNPIKLSLVIDKFFKRFNFASLYVYDNYNKLIVKHEATDKKNTLSLRVILHNAHLYIMNDNLKSLYQMSSDIDYSDDKRDDLHLDNKYFVKKAEKTVQEEIKDDQKDVVTVSKISEHFCSDMNEIIDVIKKQSQNENIQVIKIITSTDLNMILHDLINSGYSPKCYFHTFLHKINYKIHSKLLISIETADDNPIYGKNVFFENYEHYKVYDNAYTKIYDEIFKDEHLSDINPDVKLIESTYKIRAIQGKFNDDIDYNRYSIIDENKAYSECLQSITEIPIFNFFDMYYHYDNHILEDLTYYIIELDDVTDSIKMLFEQKINRIYGFVLKQINVNYKIHYFRRPYKIEDVDYKTYVDDLYNNENIEIDYKKNIANKITGLLERRVNRAEYTEIYKDFNEANSHRIKYDGRLIPVEVEEVVKSISTNKLDKDIDSDDDVILMKVKKSKPLFILNIGREEQLINGFQPIKDIIYCRQKLKMYQLYNKLVELNINIIGTKTDCIYFYKSDVKLDKHFKIDGEIGSYKIEHNKYLPSIHLNIEQNTLLNITDYTNINAKTFTDEFDTATINEYIESNNNILIKGLYPGVGKSTLCKNFDDKSLFILPYNKLCQNLRVEGYEAITFNKLFGLFFDEKENTNVNVKRFDYSIYSTIVFDECFLHSPDRLKKIYYFSRSNPNIKFMSTGDADQRDPISFRDSDYLNKCMNITFPTQILLSDIKRLTNNADKLKWIDLKNDILNSNKSVELICKDHKINTITHITQLTTLNNICYFNNRCLQVNTQVYKNVLKRGNNQFIVGVNVICKKHLNISSSDKKAKKNGTLHTNYQYKITKITSSAITLHDEVDDIYYDVRPSLMATNFRLAHAHTCDSVQGMSFDEPITILDANIPYVDRKFIWTALTRCRKLSDVTFFIHPKSEVQRWTINRFN